ncbi:MAG: hypothetical protein M1827_006034 [Pycnora praestabilis]|nr:MAG: hypothetical protein M1827_006034 [Pycnora praestabilis]
MASIFSFDPDPPRVSSPWSAPKASTPQSGAAGGSTPSISGIPSRSELRNLQPTLLSDCGITRLEAEPQEGPTEYKLHLLLRPRRSFSSSTTGQHVSGSHHSRVIDPRVRTTNGPPETPPPSAPSNQSRQNRLEQLTTQLLWRLQQSSPYHASSTSNLVLPNLPEATPVLGAPTRPGRLLAGLEESRGALYEIGVSDDGAFVGLVEDEMEESLNNLRAMAASLGCKVELLRMVTVGECEWIEETQPSSLLPGTLHTERLWVAEALVKPDLGSSKQQGNDGFHHSGHTDVSISSNQDDISALEDLQSGTEQLRVSLTGATTSGKSSLLGTLSTATLDNGRGKSRLSLLRHRHEIASGVTSSVAQELIGYRSVARARVQRGTTTEIINYASGNVSSWNDIHASSEGGRLVFVSDSAGHPRYRRTTVRGLIGWAPHWTVLCVAADDGDDGAAKLASSLPAHDISLSATAGTSLSFTHLEFCLKLGSPLVVIFTKLDLASKQVLRRRLAKVLSTLKSAGRRPLMLSNATKGISLDTDLQSISNTDEHEVVKVLAALASDEAWAYVPILLTSAVRGTGIGKMHALLRNLPIPIARRGPNTVTDSGKNATSAPTTFFHIEDVFAMPASSSFSLRDSRNVESTAGSVVSGHLRYGQLSVGDELLIGPVDNTLEQSSIRVHAEALSSSPVDSDTGSPRLTPVVDRARLSSGSPRQRSSRLAVDSPVLPEWRRIRIVSIRNLRLSVRTLLAGQVGTVGVVQSSNISAEVGHSQNEGNGRHDGATVSSTSQPSASPRIRKGMVITEFTNPPSTFTGFVGLFEDSHLPPLSQGSLVVVYTASIRASARIIHIQTRSKDVESPDLAPRKLDPDLEPDDVFGFDENDNDSDDASGGVDLPTSTSPPTPHPQSSMIELTFEFVTYKEWIELDTQVLIMPGGGPGLYGGSERGQKGVAGLEGFVGRVVEGIV